MADKLDRLPKALRKNLSPEALAALDTLAPEQIDAALSAAAEAAEREAHGLAEAEADRADLRLEPARWAAMEALRRGLTPEQVASLRLLSEDQIHQAADTVRAWAKGERALLREDDPIHEAPDLALGCCILPLPPRPKSAEGLPVVLDWAAHALTLAEHLAAPELYHEAKEEDPATAERDRVVAYIAHDVMKWVAAVRDALQTARWPRHEEKRPDEHASAMRRIGRAWLDAQPEGPAGTLAEWCARDVLSYMAHGTPAGLARPAPAEPDGGEGEWEGS